MIRGEGEGGGKGLDWGDPGPAGVPSLRHELGTVINSRGAYIRDPAHYRGGDASPEAP